MVSRKPTVFGGGRGLVLAYDHGLEHGPTDFSQVPESANPRYVFEIAEHENVTSLAVQKGLAETYGDEYDVSLLVKLNGKTGLTQTEPYSPKNCTVEYAVGSLDADAVGYTLYPGSNHESEMFEEFREVQESAREHGVPVVVWSYPRGQPVKDDSSTEIVSYAARVGLELGADAVKVKYPGSREGMERVVSVSGETKVVMSGGSKRGSFLEDVENVVEAGGDGVAVGRNVFQRENPEEFLDELGDVLFG
ncbi:MAG: aldolase [Halobacteria archaeon]|nr:aldolase [Halobacteria archaeon]